MKFEEVKNSVNIKDVASYYGLKFNRNNKCLCPFHTEYTPSFSISESKQLFNCFGCGEKGDVISLVSKLEKVDLIQASKIIIDRFHLGIDTEPNKTLMKEIQEQKHQREKEKLEIKNTFILLCDYAKLLKKLENINPEYELYLEYCNNYDWINYVLDEIFLSPVGAEEEIKNFIRSHEEKIRRIKNLMENKSIIEKYILWED